MAFKDAYMTLSDFIGGKHPIKSWMYTTEDTPDEVGVFGYFNGKVDEFDLGDRIWVYHVIDRDDLASGINRVSMFFVVFNDGAGVGLNNFHTSQ